MTCNCKCIPTPQSIYDDTGEDVFETIFPDSEEYHDIMREIMWTTYRFRGIGNCDLAYWKQCMSDRYFDIKFKYMPKFKAVEEWLTIVMDSDNPIDMSDGSSESKTTTAYGHKITDSRGATKTTAEHEDNPDNPAGNTKYLANRDTTSGDAVTDTQTHSESDTVTFNDKRYSGLSSETLTRFMEMVPDIEREFADEFRKQFYWGL